jgi:hypothetical protein
VAKTNTRIINYFIAIVIMRKLLKIPKDSLKNVERHIKRIYAVIEQRGKISREVSVRLALFREELYELKGSRTVLKPSQEGDLLA